MLNVCFSGTAAGSMNLFREEFGVAKSSIIDLDLYLHCGDISDPFQYETRREVFEALFISEDVSKAIYDNSVNRFRKRVSGVKNVCIWYSRNLPDEYLGFLFLVDHLKEMCNIYYCDCSEMQGGLSEVQFENKPFLFSILPLFLQDIVHHKEYEENEECGQESDDKFIGAVQLPFRRIQALAQLRIPH